MPRFRPIQIHHGVSPFRGILRGLGATAPSASVTQLVLAAAQQYGVDPELAMAVAQRESGLNPNAYNAATQASGVMQLEPATASSLGVTNIFDPQQNVYAGVHYLGMMLSQFGGDTAMAVAAYDWGPGNVQSAVNTYGTGWLSAAPVETKNYVYSLTGQLPSSGSGQSVTVDASTGQVVQDDTDVNALPTIDSSGVITPAPDSLDLNAMQPVGLDLNTVLIFGLVAMGAWWILVDIL